MINDTKNKVKAYCAKREAAKAQTMTTVEPTSTEIEEAQKKDLRIHMKNVKRERRLKKKEDEKEQELP